MSHLDNHRIPASRQREVPRKGLNWIGKSMKRVEDPRLLTGKGRYVDDIILPNMGHAAFLRSPHAHAKIKSINTKKAEALEGVIVVVTGAHAAMVMGPTATFWCTMPWRWTACVTLVKPLSVLLPRAATLLKTP
jgi:Aldehyde oxidase and xanthine dehydrogenase, a/b hammerhead domain